MKIFVFLMISLALVMSMLITCIYANNTISSSDCLEMRGLIEEALAYGDAMKRYFPNIAIWIEEYNYCNPVDLPQYSDTMIEVDGADYLLLYENLLPGGSYQNLRNYAEEIFTSDMAAKATTQAYLDNSRPLFYTSDDKKTYIASPATLLYYYLFDDNTDDTLQIIESDAEQVTARICLYVSYMGEDTPDYEMFHQYPAWVECKFTKTDNGWRIDDSAFTDMITSTHFDSTFCTEDNPLSPSTGDPNVSRVWWLAGVSLAALVPAVCLVRRRREDRF